jgi:hypothetical protein
MLKNKDSKSTPKLRPQDFPDDTRVLMYERAIAALRQDGQLAAKASCRVWATSLPASPRRTRDDAEQLEVGALGGCSTWLRHLDSI